MPVPLPPYRPELNPAEQIFRHLRKRLAKDLLRRVQLRRVRRQRQRHNPLRPNDFRTAMTARSIEHDTDPLVRPFRAHRREEEIKANRIDMR